MESAKLILIVIDDGLCTISERVPGWGLWPVVQGLPVDELRPFLEWWRPALVRD
jgi:hypothetical protein